MGLIDNTGTEKDFTDAVCRMIGQASEAGELISESEILRRIDDQDEKRRRAADIERLRTMLREFVSGSGNLQCVISDDGSCRYYSSQYMNEVYAGILLQKEGDPRQLIADMVRHNSEVYPRPLPLDFFTQPPFNFTQPEVAEVLDQMSSQREYADIMTTTTSASRIFLYSTLHLESDHASMLAEWLDVGQSENP